MTQDTRPSPLEEEHYQDHLDQGRIDDSAMLALRRLYSADGAAFIDYQPGNVTRYQLVFTRLYLSPARKVEKPDATPEGSAWGMSHDGSFVVVAWLEHGAYPFAIMSPRPGYVDAGYLESKFAGRCQWGDAIALAALLNRMIEMGKEFNFYRQRNGWVVALPPNINPVDIQPGEESYRMERCQ